MQRNSILILKLGVNDLRILEVVMSVVGLVTPTASSYSSAYQMMQVPKIYHQISFKEVSQLS